MRIGIISVNNAHNFGTSMQAYAFKQYLQSAGHTVQVINYRNPAIESSYRICKKPRKNLKSIVKYSVKYVGKVVLKPYLPIRRKRFEKFFSKNYNLTEPATSFKQLCNAGYRFDVALQAAIRYGTLL